MLMFEMQNRNFLCSKNYQAKIQDSLHVHSRNYVKRWKKTFLNPEPDATINESRILTKIQWSSNLFSPKHVGMNCMKKMTIQRIEAPFNLVKLRPDETNYKFQQIINTEHISPRNNCFDKKVKQTS